MDRGESFPGLRPLQPLVIPVEEENPTRFQAVLNAHFLQIDIVLGPKLLNVGQANVGDHRHIHLGNAGNHRQLSRLAHPQLNNAYLILRAYLRQGDGHPHLAVMVAGRFIDLIPCRQGGAYHLPGGGLPHTAGNAD